MMACKFIINSAIRAPLLQSSLLQPSYRHAASFRTVYKLGCSRPYSKLTNDTKPDASKLNDLKLNGSKLNDPKLNDPKPYLKLNDSKLNDSKLNDSKLTQ